MLQALRLPREPRFLLDIQNRLQPEPKSHPTLSTASDAVNFIPELLASLKEAGFNRPTPQEKIVEEQDWVRLKQSQFAPIQIGERIWVVPSWHEAPTDPNAICLAVDPGLAFGTGSHPTTHLCLLWLEQNTQLANQSLLDYGCGSGILAIAAAKLGCNPVVGTDIDPQAMVAARSNAEINKTTISFVLPNENAPELAAERTLPFLKLLRQYKPNTPILLVEQIDYPTARFVLSLAQKIKLINQHFNKAYTTLKNEGDKNIYYLPSKGIIEEDGEGTVDGVHLTDLGFYRMANAIKKKLQTILK